MNALDGLGGVLAVGALIVAQFASAVRGRQARREREAAAAVAPLPAPSRPSGAAVPIPGRRSAAPAARLPQRVPSAAASTAAPPRDAPIPGIGPRAAGPRWAANAFIAAEVFGAPVADRPGGPGGTLGPPNAF